MVRLRTASVVVVEGVLVAGCSTPGVSAPAAGGRPAAVGSSPQQMCGTAPRDARVTSVIAAFRLPARVSRPVVYPVGHGLLVVGGLTATDTTTSEVLHVGLAGGVVDRVGRLSVGVHDAGGAVVAGRDLLFGGGSTVVTDAVQDVTAGDLPRVVGHLPQARADLVAISEGTVAYILGGFDGVKGSVSVLQTRDGRTFTVLGDLPVPVRYPAVALSRGSIWLFGGEQNGKQVSDVQRMDLRTGKASVAGHLPRHLAHAGAFTLAGAVFVAGGRTGATAADAVMCFDPATVTFRTAGRLPAARSDFGVAVVSDVAYLVGGESPSPVDTVFEVRAQGRAAP